MRCAALTVALLAAGCAWREPGLEVDVSLEVTSSDASTFETATLAVEGVTLVPCGQASSPLRWLRELRLVGTAWAHDPDGRAGVDPRSAWVPVLVDLQRPGPQPLVTLHPPPGTWCAVELTVAPSTAQARSKGTTLLLEREGFLQLATVRRQPRVAVPALQVDEQRPTAAVALQTTFAGPADGGASATVDALLAGLH